MAQSSQFGWNKGRMSENSLRPNRWATDWQVWLGLAISALFLYWAIRQASDIRNVADALTRANYIYLLPALMVYFVGVLIRTARWQVLLRPVAKLPIGRLFSVVVIGYMANDVLPARMGELVRAYVLKRDEGISKGTSLGTIFIERVLDGLTMLAFVIGVAVFIPLDPTVSNIVRIAGPIMLGLLLVGLILTSSPKRALSLTSVALRLAPAGMRTKLAAFAERFLHGLTILQNSKAMLVALALSILAWLCEAAMYYLIGFAFSLGMGLPGYLVTTAVANLGTMVPSSPGYVGTFEALAVFTLGLFAVEGDLALSYTVALHAALLVPVTLLGFYFMWRRHVSLRLAQTVR